MKTDALIPSDPSLIELFKSQGGASNGPAEGRAGGARRIGARAAGFGRSNGSAERLGARQAMRNVYTVPQAVLKITRQGRTKGGNALRNQLQYVSRSGAEPLEGQGGEIFEPGDDGRHGELAADWQRDFDRMDARATFGTYHLVISYPHGTDPTAAKLSAREYAQALTDGSYGDRWKYALTHHRDTQFPHSHLILNRVGAEGRTLHLSRDGISIQDLRDLHVDTAGQFGITLNATSRFSRNVEDRTESSGRVHARRAGRDLPSPEPETREPDSFPFYGAARRQEITVGELIEARQDLARQYRAVAMQISGFATGKRIDSNKDLVRRLERAAELVRSDLALTEETLGMADETDVLRRAKPGLSEGRAGRPSDGGPSPMQQAERELEKLRSDLRSIYEKTRENIERIDDEGRKTEAEMSLARLMKNYECFLEQEDRAHYGAGIEREAIDTVGLNDADPVRQRKAASREASDFAQAKPDDPRTQKTAQRLDRADREVRALFAERGMNADLGMQRIKDAPDVDRETRGKWMDRDIQALARTGNVSERDARERMTKTYRDASRLYAKARDDIRTIQRDPSESRDVGKQPSHSRPKPGRDRGLDR